MAKLQITVIETNSCRKTKQTCKRTPVGSGIEPGSRRRPAGPPTDVLPPRYFVRTSHPAEACWRHRIHARRHYRSRVNAPSPLSRSKQSGHDSHVHVQAVQSSNKKRASTRITFKSNSIILFLVLSLGVPT